MLTRLACTLGIIALATGAFAQGLSQEQLTGRWEFTAFADVDAPDDRTPVGVIMDFQPDGAVITQMSTGDQEATYRLDGDTILYSSADGDQQWHIRSFEPDDRLVVEHDRSLMFFERRH